MAALRRDYVRSRARFRPVRSASRFRSRGFAIRILVLPVALRTPIRPVPLHALRDFFAPLLIHKLAPAPFWSRNGIFRPVQAFQCINDPLEPVPLGPQLLNDTLNVHRILSQSQRKNSRLYLYQRISE